MGHRVIIHLTTNKYAEWFDAEYVQVKDGAVRIKFLDGGNVWYPLSRVKRVQQF